MCRGVHACVHAVCVRRVFVGVCVVECVRVCVVGRVVCVRGVCTPCVGMCMCARRACVCRGVCARVWCVCVCVGMCACVHAVCVL